VTGTRNAHSTNTYVVPDRVDILAGSSGPSAPAGLTASGQSNAVLLSWTASPAAQYYEVFRGVTPGGESSQPLASSSATTYSDSNVVDGTVYYYSVAAVSSAGTSAPSNEASAMPGGAILPSGTYTVTKGAGTLVWDDPGFATSAGTNVVLWPANGGRNQEWTFTAVGNGYYTITNESNGLVLDDPGSSKVSGQKLIQWTSNGGTNQHWLLTNSGSGYTITNRSSALLVDDAAGTQGPISFRRLRPRSNCCR